MKSSCLRIIFAISAFTFINSSSHAQVSEEIKQEHTVHVSLSEHQQRLVDSLSELGETDLLKIKERYTYKVRTNPEDGDQYVLDRINDQIKIVRGAKIDR
jgi:hypothetical protein